MIPTKSKYCTKQEFVKSLLNQFQFGTKVLDYSVSGSCLWMVVKSHGNNEPAYIELNLIKKTDNGWQCDIFAESSHPPYYSCPVRFLDRTSGSCPEWRDKVRKYHNNNIIVL